MTLNQEQLKNCYVAECSERTLSCLEPVCLCWRPFGRYFSHHLAKSAKQEFFAQRVMAGQQILCTSVGPVWKQSLLVIGCLFLHSDWMMCLLPILLYVSVQEPRCEERILMLTLKQADVRLEYKARVDLLCLILGQTLTGS